MQGTHVIKLFGITEIQFVTHLHPKLQIEYH